MIHVHCPHCGFRDYTPDAMMTDDGPERETCADCGNEYIITITATKPGEGGDDE